MSRVWENGGLVFPSGLYGVGDHSSDDIEFSINQKVPFAINIMADQDVTLHLDAYLGDGRTKDVLYPDMIVQAAALINMPLTVQIFYVLRRWKLRIECTVPTNLTCEVVVKKET
jgi:hypothetical protein